MSDEIGVAAETGRGVGAWREFGVVALVFAALAVVLTYPVARHLSTAFAGKGGDTWQNVWNMWWIRKALLELHRTPFFTPYLYHPNGHTLLLHTLTPFHGLLAIPLRTLFGWETIWNLQFLFSFAASGVGMYYLARYLTGSRAGAMVAGVLFTFCPYHFGHGLCHQNLTAYEWLPVYLLFLLRTMDRERVRDAVWAGVFLVLLTLCSYYYLVYAAMLTAVLVAARGKAFWRSRRRVALCGLSAGIFLVVMGPLIGAMVRALVTGEFTGAHEPEKWSADLAGLFVPGPVSSYGELTRGVWTRFQGNWEENTSYVGYVALTLAVYAGARVRRARFWAVVGGAFLVLSLGPVLHVAGRRTGVPLPYGLLHRCVPFFSFTGVPLRFGLLVTLSLSLMAAYGVAHWWRVSGWGRGEKRRMTAVVAAAIMVEYLAVPFPLAQVSVPPCYREMARDGARYAVIDFGEPAEVLYLQTIHEKPILTGYTSRYSVDRLTWVREAPVVGRMLGYDTPMPPREAVRRVFRAWARKHNFRYMICRNETRARVAEQVLGLPLVDARGGVRVYDCRGPARDGAP